MNLSSALTRLRIVSLLEGWSFVLLLFVAMPLKYLAGQPEAVRVVGMAHGVLFVLCVAAAVHAHLLYRWPVKRTLLIVAATLLPFGPFVADRQILRPLEEAAPQPVS
jgi:integral membrane protein